MLERILEQVEEVRRREAAARADPGTREERDLINDVVQRHAPSRAYRDYEEAWRELGRRIDALPVPEGWLRLAERCDDDDPRFGIVAEETHDSALAWTEARSLRGALLDSVLRRTPPGLAPGEGAWADGRVTRWIASLVERRDLVPHERERALRLRRRFDVPLP